MARFLRVACMLLLALGSGLAAAYPAPIVYWHMPDRTGPHYASPELACKGLFAKFNNIGDGTYAYEFWTIETGATMWRCEGTRTDETGTVSVAGNVRDAYKCADPNTTLVIDQCVCRAGYEGTEDSCDKLPEVCEPGFHKEGAVCVPDTCKPNEIRVNGICVKEPDCPPGKERVNGVCKETGCELGKNVGYRSGMSDGETEYYCEGACQARVKASVCVTWDGKTECGGNGFLTGARCTPPVDGEQPPNTKPDPKPGDPDDQEPKPPDDDDDNGNGNPGGGGGGTGGSGPGPGTGGEPGTGEGPGSGGGGTGPGSGPGSGPGQGSGLDTPNEPVDPDEDGECPEGYHEQGRFCVQDPQEPNQDGRCPPGFVKINSKCHATYPSGGGGDGEGGGEEEGRAFGGNCDYGFTCKGDAIQCAIAKEQHRRSCQLYVLKTEESKLYYAESAKTGNRTDDLPGNETVDINGRIDSTDILGGGGGMQDVLITVAGHSITLPFSQINSILSALGNLLVAVSFLLAFRIVGRG